MPRSYLRRGPTIWRILRRERVEQQRIFRKIPGMENAAFVRYGMLHRNTYIHAPAHLDRLWRMRREPRISFAGQITGVEGDTESSATGLLAGINLARILSGDDPVIPPPTTMIGALYRYMNEADPKHFQPMNANFGLLDELPEKIRDKKRKRELFSERALGDMQAWIEANNIHGALSART